MIPKFHQILEEVSDLLKGSPLYCNLIFFTSLNKGRYRTEERDDKECELAALEFLKRKWYDPLGVSLYKHMQTIFNNSIKTEAVKPC